MIILKDTRQQAKKHSLKDDYFEQHGIYQQRTKLYCGDYTLPTDQSVCIDTKQNIGELINDIHVKVISKTDLAKKIEDLCKTLHLSKTTQDEIFHIVADEDKGRFPEKEIADFCYRNKLNGYVVICKIMQKIKKANKCIAETYLKEDCTQKMVDDILFAYSNGSSDFKANKQKILIQELLLDFYEQRHGSFHRELKRAENSGIKMFVLVENEDGIRNLEELKRWENPRLHRYNKIAYMHRIGKWNNIPLPKKPPTDNMTLYKALCTIQSRYGVEFLFCKPDEAGQKILELLKVEV